jgi:uncharacterized repeat protein (TIGR01451 family)
MKKITALLASLAISLIVISQTNVVPWQRILGGTGINIPYQTVKTNDNGIISIWTAQMGQRLMVTKMNGDGLIQWEFNYFIQNGVEPAVSYVYNTDGTIVILFRGVVDAVGTNVYDYYVIKLDNTGNKVWENYYGGTLKDVPSSIIKSVNGGYLIIGNSNSPEITHDGTGNTDAWLVKISEAGALEWQKDLGGNGTEGISKNMGRGKIVESTDGSIYVATESTSIDGDVTGNLGGQDIWLVKLNSTGVIQWTKNLGGTGGEAFSDLKLSPSGDLYVLGVSGAQELTINAALQQDIYFARVSSAGVIQFQKCYGSFTNDEGVQIASIDNDGSCVLLGRVTSANGDVQTIHGGIDPWLFKINLPGNILWQTSPGGSGGEVFSNIDEGIFYLSVTGGVIQTADGGYFMSGMTTFSDIPTYHNTQDVFTAKVSSTGTFEWARVYGGFNNDIVKGLPVELSPNVFVVGAYTDSRDGDVQKNFNGQNPWLVKTGGVNTIKGTLFLDQNNDGVKDTGEPPFSLAKVNISKGSGTWAAVPSNGEFMLTTDTGSYVTAPSLDLLYYTTVPAQHNSNFSTYFNKDSFSFAVQPIPGMQDLVVNLIPTTPARPGFKSSYDLIYRNVGTVAVPSAQVSFVKDLNSTLFFASPAISSSVGDTLKWDVSTLNPGYYGKISLTLQLAVPPTLNNGDTLNSLALITPVATDQTPNDDSAVLNQILQGSFDPNDKAENHGGSISPGQVTAGEYLNYLIRFQNMGTDMAFNIVVRDTLDNKLDWSTFEMVNASHPYQLQINNSNQVVWTFNDIDLPYSAQNEPASHGYIAYRIKPKAGLGIGASLHNRASIYFDFNLPVETNIVQTIVGAPIALPLHLVDFNANYQKPDALLEWSTADESNVEKFIIERGTDAIHFVPVGSVAAKGNSNSLTRYQFKDALVSASGDKFYYRLKMMDQDQKYTYSNIQLVKKEGRATNELIVNPNPIKGRFGFAWINLQKEARAEIGVVDMKGNYRSLGQQQINKGFNVVPLDFFGVSAGTYILEVKIGQERLVSRFVLVP